MTENNPMQNKVEYSSEAELMTEFNNYMKDPINVETATNYLFNSLVDEAILGIAFEVHHALRTGLVDAIEGQPEDNKPYSIIDSPDYDIFGASTIKKQNVDFNCPNCDRLVAASKFATHLEKCMGMGRSSLRSASRRLANTRDNTSTYFGTTMSDDDDDADWSGEKRKKRMQNSQRNGSKKNGKSS